LDDENEQHEVKQVTRNKKMMMDVMVHMMVAGDHAWMLLLVDDDITIGTFF
jgi:hypothetical protein